MALVRAVPTPRARLYRRLYGARSRPLSPLAHPFLFAPQYRNILKTYYKNDRALLLQDTEARAILGANAAAAAAQDDESE
jgi:hypothetical protein